MVQAIPLTSSFIDGLTILFPVKQRLGLNGFSVPGIVALRSAFLIFQESQGSLYGGIGDFCVHS